MSNPTYEKKELPQETKGDTSDVPPRERGTPPLISYGKLEQRILGVINKGYGIKRMARELGVSPSSIKRSIDSLRRKGWAIGLGGELLNIDSTLKSFALPQETKGDTSASWGTRNAETHDLNTPLFPMEKKNISLFHTRAHNIKLKFPLIRKFVLPDLQNWRMVGMRNNVQYHRTLGEFHIILTTQSLLIEFPSVTCADANEYMRIVEMAGSKVVDELVAMYPELQVGKPEFKRQLISQHHAIVNEPFAKWLQSKNITFSDGLFDVDASTGREELEFTDAQKANADWTKYTEVIKDVLTAPNQMRLSELYSRIEQIEQNLVKATELMTVVIKSQEVTAKQMELLLKRNMPIEPEPSQLENVDKWYFN